MVVIEGSKTLFIILNQNSFPRIRLGVAGSDYRRPSENYVMKPFNDEMVFESKVMIEKAADAIQNIIIRGLEKTMNQFNA